MPEHQQTQQSKKTNTIFQNQATPVVQTPASNPYSTIQRAKINPRSLTRADIMQLHRTIGNQAVGRLLSSIGSSSTTQQAPVQRQEMPEEEKCPSCMQRQEIPEEEKPLQGKFESIQRQEIPEEEEPLQGKLIEPIQRQEIPEEEEPLQGKFENKPEIACPSCFTAPIMQRQEIPEEEEPLQGKFETVQRQEIPEEEEPLQTKRENNTGMPDNLKAGVENLSGINMSDVRVHYNSSKPANVGALAYTQGTNIHVSPGQEKHLPHEAWHVVQQSQGRVQATTQMKGLGINDDPSLEHEADMMGEKTAQLNALAYAQGTNIHLVPGQEKHLAHEPWHVVQQTMHAAYMQRTVQRKIQAQKTEGITSKNHKSGELLIIFETFGSDPGQLIDIVTQAAGSNDQTVTVLGINEPVQENDVNKAKTKLEESINKFRNELKNINHDGILLAPFLWWPIENGGSGGRYTVPYMEVRGYLMDSAIQIRLKDRIPIYRWIDKDARDDFGLRSIDASGSRSTFVHDEISEMSKSESPEILTGRYDWRMDESRQGVYVDLARQALAIINMAEEKARNEWYRITAWDESIQVEKARKQMVDASTQVVDTRTQVEKARKQMVDASTQVEDTRTQVEDTRTQMVDASTQVEDTRTQMVDASTQVVDAVTYGYENQGQYLPEPTLYMNQAAHEKMRPKYDFKYYSDPSNQTPTSDQSRESQRMVLNAGGMKVRYNPENAVTKPLKYEKGKVDYCEMITKIADRSLHLNKRTDWKTIVTDGIINLRQSAMSSQWAMPGENEQTWKETQSRIREDAISRIMALIKNTNSGMKTAQQLEKISSPAYIRAEAKPSTRL